MSRRILPSSPIICDVGSRDALEGVYLIEQLGAAKLHVFEPNPQAAEVCRENLRQVNPAASWIEFNQMAVSDRAGELPFYPVNAELSQNKDIGFSSLFRVNPQYTKRRGSIVQREITVPVTTLDTYFESRPHPDLLWVDVEGAELQVFRGARNILRKVRLIHVEVSFRPMQVGKPLFWEIADYLRACGFAFRHFAEVSPIRSFLYRRRLLPNLPWRLNAVFVKHRPNLESI